VGNTSIRIGKPTDFTPAAPSGATAYKHQRGRSRKENDPFDFEMRSRETALESELQNLQTKMSELNSQLHAVFNEMKAP